MPVNRLAHLVGVRREIELGERLLQLRAVGAAAAGDDVAADDVRCGGVHASDHGRRGTAADADHAGYLGRLEPLADVQIEERIVARIEGRRRVPDQGAKLRVGADAGRVADARGVGDIERAERLLVPRRERRERAAFRPRDGRLVRDREKPGFEAHRLAGSGQSFEGASEGLARHFRRRIVVAQDAPREVVDTANVAVVELTKAVEIAAKRALGEQRVIHGILRLHPHDNTGRSHGLECRIPRVRSPASDASDAPPQRRNRRPRGPGKVAALGRNAGGGRRRVKFVRTSLTARLLIFH